MLRRLPPTKGGDSPITSATSGGFGIVAKPFRPPSALASKRTTVLPARKRKVVSYKEMGEGTDDGEAVIDDDGSPKKKMRFEMGNKVYEDGVLGGMAKWCTRKFPVFEPKEKGAVFAKTFAIPVMTNAKTSEKILHPLSHASLGARPHPTLAPRPLHDPMADHAIVLYDPTIDDKPDLKEKEGGAVEAPKEDRGPHKSLKTILGIKDKKEKVEVRVPVVIDPRLSKVLRPHQIEGVKFLYKCTTGMLAESAWGCIMADEMGLGKTLQCIALLWTLLKQSPVAGKGTCEKVIIACPTSLVGNWANELIKWLGPGAINPLVVDGKGGKAELIPAVRRWVAAHGRNITLPVMIVSYETLRTLQEELANCPIGLLLADEGHRLKNAETLTFQALTALNVKRRVILTGTPIQNDLSEYFALLNFANPEYLGSKLDFKRNFEHKILRGRDADATDKEKEESDAKLKELGGLVNRFIIRRTNDLLSKYLPVKYEHVVFCRPSPLQTALYNHFVNSKDVQRLLRGKDSQPLKAIGLLRKLCNHPQLLNLPEDLSGSEKLLPDDYHQGQTGRERGLNCTYSGKFVVLERMLDHIRNHTTDKIVLISNATQTLDLMERLCRAKKYGHVRLDGTMSVKKRSTIVDRFNDPEGKEFVFLLSSKAGGCGINLIGANRLILFDPDWNPASDQQALARVWRDGQKKECFVYRFMTTGSIEEKIFQRQCQKQNLSACVVDEAEDTARHFTQDDLKQLFKFAPEAACETHETYKCKRCRGGKQFVKAPALLYGDASTWNHFPNSELGGMHDDLLRAELGLPEVSCLDSMVNLGATHPFKATSSLTLARPNGPARGPGGTAIFDDILSSTLSKLSLPPSPAHTPTAASSAISTSTSRATFSPRPRYTLATGLAPGTFSIPNTIVTSIGREQHGNKTRSATPLSENSDPFAELLQESGSLSQGGGKGPAVVPVRRRTPLPQRSSRVPELSRLELNALAEELLGSHQPDEAGGDGRGTRRGSSASSDSGPLTGWRRRVRNRMDQPWAPNEHIQADVYNNRDLLDPVGSCNGSGILGSSDMAVLVSLDAEEGRHEQLPPLSAVQSGTASELQGLSPLAPFTPPFPLNVPSTPPLVHDLHKSELEANSWPSPSSSGPVEIENARNRRVQTAGLGVEAAGVEAAGVEVEAGDPASTFAAQLREFARNHGYDEDEDHEEVVDNAHIVADAPSMILRAPVPRAPLPRRAVSRGLGLFELDSSSFAIITSTLARPFTASPSTSWSQRASRKPRPPPTPCPKPSTRNCKRSLRPNPKKAPSLEQRSAARHSHLSRPSSRLLDNSTKYPSLAAAVSNPNRGSRRSAKGRLTMDVAESSEDAWYKNEVKKRGQGGAYARYTSQPSPRLNIPSSLQGVGHSPLQNGILSSWRDAEPTVAQQQNIRTLLNILTGVINRSSRRRNDNPRGDRFVVDVFGSVAWGGGTGKRGDVDLVVIDKNHPLGYSPDVWRVPASKLLEHGGRVKVKNPKLPPIYNMHALKGYLSDVLDFTDCMAIFAHVPIVKFNVPVYDIQCDICLNDLGGWYNSALILAYCELSPYVLRPMIHVMKLWLSAHNLNDSSGRKGPRTMSSYSFTLMVIAYLQHVGMLPNLQAGVPTPATADPRDTRAGNTIWVCYGREQGEATRISFERRAPEGWTPRSPDLTVAEAVRGFFKYFSQEGSDAFDYRTRFVSILNGGIAQRRNPPTAHGTPIGGGFPGINLVGKCDMWQPTNWDDQMLLVQDPFQWRKNVAKTLWEGRQEERFFECIARTHHFLERNPHATVEGILDA